ncbi:hypothetical protein [Streptomyces sp. AN091965]|uniref:hypothetical protein n=1 Tax=Streptomyces sp. AN091965 TaxID=2927803 RepID=UPI001F61DDA0|nr:hypothetical protein [Streptomyces sp. AN091965]MCI3929979.1 hypothetical protein [Streptomyces sp. AN091965]
MRKQFGVWAREWMAVQKPRGRTTTNRRERLEAHILPKWKHTPLVAFNWFDVEAWARTLVCAPRTTRESVQLISRILTGAVDGKHLLVNPLHGRRLTGLSGAEQAPTPEAVAHEGSEVEDDDSIIATPEEVLLLARLPHPGDAQAPTRRAAAAVRSRDGQPGVVGDLAGVAEDRRLMLIS